MTAEEDLTIAVIPARGGSKRIPRKNIKLFAGEPLMIRTIRKLQSLGIFDHIVVTTDDDEIASIASSAGAFTLRDRPAELSDDHATTAQVMSFELGRFTSIFGSSPTRVCTVYPGAILVDAESIRSGLARLMSSDLDAVISALPHPSPIWRAWQLDADGTASMVWPEYRTARTQDLRAAYYDAGQFYWSNSSYWENQTNPEKAALSRIGLQILKPWEAVDIDTPEDWDLAERLFRSPK